MTVTDQFILDYLRERLPYEKAVTLIDLALRDMQTECSECGVLLDPEESMNQVCDDAPFICNDCNVACCECNEDPTHYYDDGYYCDEHYAEVVAETAVQQ